MTTPLAVSLAGRDFLRISDLVPAEAEAILDRAVELRLAPRQPLLPGATLGLYFAKHSTRTRVSFSAGMAQLGGAAIHLALARLQGDGKPRWIDDRGRKITVHGFRSTMATWAQEQRRDDGSRPA